jgi:replication initiation and membrane attachment protein DnaB
MYVHICIYKKHLMQCTMKPKTVFAEKRNPGLESRDDIYKSIQKYNPTLKNILKVEELLAEYKEFDSKAQLVKKLDVTMRPPVLNVILRYLVKSNKVLLNKDGSIVWIYASPTAKKRWDAAIKL